MSSSMSTRLAWCARVASAAVLAAAPLLTLVLMVVRAQAPGGGPEAAYALSEGAGGTAGDLSGNGHTGTLVNNPTWTAAGRFGAALIFDGLTMVSRFLQAKR